MDKKDIAAFFDRCAPGWDADMVRSDEIIGAIMLGGGIREGIHVLDVACGTGVLFPDYLKRNVASVTGIDISPEMAKLAQSKFPQVKVLCGDVEETEFDRQFDAVMVYNAFPHFPEPARLIKHLATLVKPGGRLSIAHGMSREALQAHHAGRAARVSIDLLHEKELAKLLEPWFKVDVLISTDRMYQVAGVRRAQDEHSHGGISHSHSHGSHSHSHSQDLAHSAQEAAPMEELLALMKYMVNHNDAHAQEMAVLASQLRELGKAHAYDAIMDAVSDFDMVNAKFSAVLRELLPEL